MVPPLKTLKKETLGETYEYINKIIKNGNFDEKEFIKYDENLNVFEKKVQAMYIDTFKIKEGVISCLLSNDPHLVRRVLKCDWFFEDALPPKYYEQDIFPNVSFSTRCKIINKLAKNIKSEQHAQELFQFTIDNYGSKFAEMFLAKCSFQFVSDYFTKCNPLFNHHNSEKNLINICKRFPDIVISFLQNEMSKSDFLRSSKQRSKLIKYLAKNHPLAFMPILEKFYVHMYYFQFGKKSSKVLRSELMKLVQKVPDILLSGKMKIPVIFKCLTFEEQIILLKLIIKSNNSGYDYNGIKVWSLSLRDIIDLIELKPLNERVRLVETVFLQLFNENYLDHPEVWSVSCLELFPTDYRERLVEVLQKKNEDKAIAYMLQSECGDCERDTKDILIYLLRCKNAFPLLTQLMTQMTTVERREILLKEMVNFNENKTLCQSLSTCLINQIRNSIINRDSEGLESVVRYMSIRHKNEDPVIMRHLVSYHLLACPSMINLKAWDSLEELATMFLVNMKESNLYGEIIESYIAFKLKNNLDARPQIKNMVKLNFVSRQSSLVLVRRMEKPYSKTLLMLYYDEIFSGEKEYAAADIQEKLILSLLMSVNEYNKTVRRTRIKTEDLPFLVESIDKIIKKIDDGKNNSPFVPEILKNKFLKNRYANFLLDFSMEPKILQYLLKSHPRYIICSLDKIMNYIFGLDENRKFEKLFTSRCQIDFLEWLPQLEKVIFEKFKTSLTSLVKVNALKIYSHIANIDNFTELVEEYLPNDERLNFDKSKADFHEIQISVPGIIRNVKPVSKNLELVLKYLKKDFLRWVVPSFFSVCHNSSVNIIIPILRHHFPQKDVSVKKVILSCILDLSTKAEKFEYCKLLWEKENHSSVREFLFRNISGSLREDPSHKIFEMVKKCISESDEVIIKGKLNMGMIPLQFLNEYTNALWEFTEKNESRRFAMNYRREIINHFASKTISVLSKEFCEKVLRLYLFESNADVRVEDFGYHFLVHHPETMDEKLSFILGLMRERRTNYSSVAYFINHLIRMAKNDLEPVFAISEALLKEWSNMYGACKMFKEYLLLNYIKGYGTALKIGDSQSELFAAALGGELRKIVNAVPMYDYYVQIFKLTLSEFVSAFNFQNILQHVISNFLGSSFGLTEGIIAINLFPRDVFDSFKMTAEDPQYINYVGTREKYRNAFTKLTDKNDDILKIYMNLNMDNVLD